MKLVLVTVVLQLVTSLVRAQQLQQDSVPRVVGEQGGVISLECVRYRALSLVCNLFLMKWGRLSSQVITDGQFG